jgi:hypothetical protein
VKALIEHTHPQLLQLTFYAVSDPHTIFTLRSHHQQAKPLYFASSIARNLPFSHTPGRFFDPIDHPARFYLAFTESASMEFELDSYQTEVPEVSSVSQVQEAYLRGPPPRQLRTVFQATLGINQALASQAKYRVGVADL